MLQSSERAHRVIHLIVPVVPVHLRVSEVVEHLLATFLLSVVEQRHTVEGESQHREGILVCSVHIR